MPSALSSSKARAAAAASSLRPSPALKLLTALCDSLRSRAIAGPDAVAVATAKALKTVVQATRKGEVADLAYEIRRAGKMLQDAQPGEQAVTNTVMRILHLLFEESRVLASERSGLTTPVHSAPQTPLAAAPSSSSVASPFSPVSPSSASTGMSSRPSLSAFRPGSTFSIADLVAAGATSGAASGTTTPTSGNSNSSFGAASLEQSMARLGMGSTLHEGDEDDADEDEEEDEGDEDNEDEDEDSDDDDSRTEAGNAGRYTTGADEEELKPLVVQAILELIDEFEVVDSTIAKDARDHVHSGEVILTLGYSPTIDVFLKAAAKERSFTVIVAETAPSFSGHALARSLASHPSLSVLLVPDSAVFALMPRISRLLLSPHAILPNGALLSCAGSALLAAAARAHSTPVVALAGLHRLCADWDLVGACARQDAGGIPGGEGDPSAVLPRDLTRLAEEAEIVNPTWDYVEPCDVLLTNVGEHPPSFVYRLIKENYHVDA